MQIVFWIISFLVLLGLVWLGIQGILFFGWAIAWLIIIALGFMFIEEVLELNWLVGLILAVILIAGLLNWLA